MEKLRVLIVDDEEELVHALVERLQLREIDAQGVTAGAEALERIRSEQFDEAEKLNSAAQNIWDEALGERHSSAPSSLNNSVAASLKPHTAGLTVNTVDTHKRYYDASAPYRDRAIRGILPSGRLAPDPRSRNRRTL